MRTVTALAACTLVLAVAPVRAELADEALEQQSLQIAHNENWNVVSDEDAANAEAMLYHGGAVMTRPAHVYFIWYGDWSEDPRTIQILTDLASNLGGSPYLQTNTIYADGAGNAATDSLTYAGAYFDRYSQGRELRDEWAWFDIDQDIGYLAHDPMANDRIHKVVSHAIGRGLPADPDGIYVVVPSRDVVSPPAFSPGPNCGWHGHFTKRSGFGPWRSENDVKFIFVGNFNNAQSCGGFSPSPNDDPAADSMASILAHEIDEVLTDPDANAWFDAQGEENADKCAWNFGSDVGFLPNGAIYNVTLGERHFYIQQNWVNDGNGGGRCAMSLGGSPAAVAAVDAAEAGPGFE